MCHLLVLVSSLKRAGIGLGLVTAGLFDYNTVCDIQMTRFFTITENHCLRI